ncbi:hypothetical protein FJV41_20810 [Myxococcus llanfairpwllgwyngyllgogerychwyrndrobwllllantysiliogogogochensis]|uniref:Lipoprotein n=1 Tax=Myxococcus llanfairpwllgwyngyllgogerychwyrndrobwllllantysiliogogogochensis TaxID=2590453 RepID=A0A540WYF4_9BACT|nr:hypothetical protein [Myxococcus llanfairpwllgwyngyllgogerychwyrndrobwllllantysiliogogogochensis]TQF14042.1 hypothetical protein FJV41_20810 [Myxococcus llanfairpwllgwyngyllgogerychwyrndrobwllllantysiliogogogochensis]
MTTRPLLILFLLLSMAANAQTQPRFRPTEVRQQCKRLSESLRMMEGTSLAGAAFQIGLKSAMASAQMGDARAARATIRKATAEMRTLLDGLEALIDAQVYFAQLVEHLKSLTSREREKLRVPMTECFVATGQLHLLPSPDDEVASEEPAEVDTTQDGVVYD